jgi:putative FmdB family regulatory protein
MAKFQLGFEGDVMPIYEYVCGGCGRTFEEFQSIKAPPLETCSLCGSKKVRRLVSCTSFILKGSGWYVTDYARNGSGRGNGKAKDKGKEGKESPKDSGSKPAGSGDAGASPSKSADGGATHATS